MSIFSLSLLGEWIQIFRALCLQPLDILVPDYAKILVDYNIFDFSLFLVFHYWQLDNVNIAAWWWCEYWEKLPYYNSNCTKVRDKLVRESYETSMGPLTLCHFCITPIFTYTMVEEILENPQLDFWWFMVRCSSWRRMNLWPWNTPSYVVDTQFG